MYLHACPTQYTHEKNSAVSFDSSSRRTCSQTQYHIAFMLTRQQIKYLYIYMTVCVSEYKGYPEVPKFTARTEKDT
jgi:hypothetical protein